MELPCMHTLPFNGHCYRSLCNGPSSLVSKSCRFFPWSFPKCNEFLFSLGGGGGLRILYTVYSFTLIVVVHWRFKRPGRGSHPTFLATSRRANNLEMPSSLITNPISGFIAKPSSSDNCNKFLSESKFPSLQYSIYWTWLYHKIKSIIMFFEI